MKALLVMNPGSRSGKGRRLWSFWESGLRSRGIPFETVITQHAGHAVQLAADAGDYDTVVAVGGDGTVNGVLDGIIRSGRSDLRMGILYSGTSPDFCRFHNIPVSPLEAVEVLAAGLSRKVDVGWITYSDAGGGRITSHFGCGVNVGLGASVARISNRLRRFTGDFAGTCAALIYSIAMARPGDIEVKIDGVSQVLEKVNNLSILKNPYIASGLRLNLDLAGNDGGLILLAVQGKSRCGLLSLMPDFYSGNAAKRGDITVRRCQRIEVGSPAQAEVEFDGDPRGFLPAEIEIMPEALYLIGAGNERI